MTSQSYVKRIALFFVVLMVASIIATHFATRRDYADCGDLDQAVDLTAWSAGGWCRLSGTVSRSVAIGPIDGTASGASRYRQARIFGQVGEAPLVIAIEGTKVADHLEAHDDRLTGYRFTLEGKMLDPDRSVLWRELGEKLRSTLRMPEGAQLWILDATDTF